jgi:hypothetical protein
MTAIEASDVDAVDPIVSSIGNMSMLVDHIGDMVHRRPARPLASELSITLLIGRGSISIDLRAGSGLAG